MIPDRREFMIALLAALAVASRPAIASRPLVRPGDVWVDAVRRAWLNSGGDEVSFLRAFPLDEQERMRASYLAWLSRGRTG